MCLILDWNKLLLIFEIENVKKRFTISIFTENHVGLLTRITIILTRRHINIESIAASESWISGIHKYTIVVNLDEESVKKLVKQIDKQVEVVKAVYHTDDNIIYREIALYKLPYSDTILNLSLIHI